MDNKEKIRRITAIKKYWEANERTMHFHIPDLYLVDPAAKDIDPHVVPSSFIPIPAGGLIDIYNELGRKIDSESKEFILASFIPGSYKKRWYFKMFRGKWVVAEGVQLQDKTDGFADIKDTFTTAKVIALTNESMSKYCDLLSVFKFPPEETSIYIPDGIVVETIGEKWPYFWIESLHHIVHLTKEIPDDEPFIKLTRDPSSIALWFLVPQFNYKNIGFKKLSISKETNGLIIDCRHIPSVKFIKCYYANIINLFYSDAVTKIINFYHTKDKKFAILGSEILSQGILFNISLTVFREKLKEILKNKIRKEEIIFSLIYTKLWNELFLSKSLISCLYDIDKIYEILIALDNWTKIHYKSKNLLDFWKNNSSNLKEAFAAIFPPIRKSYTRLRFLGYDDISSDNLTDFLLSNSDTILNMLQESYKSENIENHLLDLLIHTFTHSLLIYAQSKVNTSSGSLRAWIEPIADDTDNISIIFYDTIQGGSGVATEFFNKIKEEKDEIISRIEEKLFCQSSFIEDLIVHILSNESPEIIFDLINSDIEAMKDLVVNHISSIKPELLREERKSELDEIKHRTFLKMKNLSLTTEMISFYQSLAKRLTTLKKQINRTPTVVDLILEISDGFFLDPRAESVFRFYAKRTRRLLSELALRCNEITKSCNRACPDCLIIQGCGFEYTIGEYMLDKNALNTFFDLIG